MTLSPGFTRGYFHSLPTAADPRRTAFVRWSEGFTRGYFHPLPTATGSRHTVFVRWGEGFTRGYFHSLPTAAGSRHTVFARWGEDVTWGYFHPLPTAAGPLHTIFARWGEDETRGYFHPPPTAADPMETVAPGEWVPKNNPPSCWDGVNHPQTNRGSYSIPCCFKIAKNSAWKSLLWWCSVWPAIYLTVASTWETPIVNAP